MKSKIIGDLQDNEILFCLRLKIDEQMTQIEWYYYVWYMYLI